jgi:hypothetical protein
MAKTKEAPALEQGWEIKDRTYLVTGRYKPLTLRIPSKHSAKVPLLWYDSETNTQRELRYATNQNSPFVDDQKGEVTLGTILFKDGALIVPKEKQALQKLLSLYHPMKGKRYKEFDSVVEATDELDMMELQIERVEVGSKVNTMSSKELKRDALIFARQNPVLFIELAKDDNVQLRNFAVKAAEAKIIKLSDDQRSFSWASNGKKLMTVPFDENPYSAMAAFFKTDEGVEVFKSIEKKLK